MNLWRYKKLNLNFHTTENFPEIILYVPKSFFLLSSVFGPLYGGGDEEHEHLSGEQEVKKSREVFIRNKSFSLPYTTKKQYFDVGKELGKLDLRK